MAIVPLVDASADPPRRGASRPTIVLGFSCLGGFVGLFAAGFFGFHALGMELPDHADLLPFCILVGAGVGWLIGAALGSIAGRAARAPGRAGRRLVLLGAVVVVIGAFVLASLPVPAGWPEGGVTLFSYWRYTGGAMAAVAVGADAAIALATIWWVSREHPTGGSSRPGRVAGATGIAGLGLGGLSLVFVVWFVAVNWASTVDDQKYRVVSKTTNSLASAASRRLDRTGSFPKTLVEALTAGARIQPGARVEFVGVVNGSFCARVGVETGGERAGDPHYSALVHRRPKGSNSWTSLETGQRNSCASQ